MEIHATTILTVRHNGIVAMGGDGQVTLGSSIMKADATKIRRLLDDKVLCGFAGSSADSFALLERFEAKLKDFPANIPRAATELAKDWRTDKYLRNLEAMGVRGFVVRHPEDGAVAALAEAAGEGTALINAGDGRSAHPTQGLLDMLTMRQHKGHLDGLKVAIVGDITHSRVARSNVALLQMMGARVRLIGPPTLVPGDADRWGCEVFHDMREGLKGCDVVMMLRLQLERMAGALVPSTREYFRFWGLDREKLAWAKPGARVMHPGPMNRGVEIDSDVADDLDVSLIQDQVEMGVAARMAVLASLSARWGDK